VIFINETFFNQFLFLVDDFNNSNNQKTNKPSKINSIFEGNLFIYLIIIEIIKMQIYLYFSQ
jgi:hypothetical protein